MVTRPSARTRRHKCEEGDFGPDIVYDCGLELAAPAALPERVGGDHDVALASAPRTSGGDASLRKVQQTGEVGRVKDSGCSEGVSGIIIGGKE